MAKVNAAAVDPDPIIVTTPLGTAATITWMAGTGVKDFTITGLSTDVFSASGTTGATASFTVTDKNATNNTYSYTVNATKSDGTKVRFDPKIQNGSGGSDG